MTKNKNFKVSVLSIILIFSLLQATPLSANEPLVKNLAVPYSKQVPNFPKSVADYKLKIKKSYDYIRVFSESNWEVPISNFDPTRGGGASMSCQPSFWVLRWRSNNKDVTILASAGITDAGRYSKVYKSVEGGGGFMAGYSCVVPAFKFGRALNGNQANLVDVNFEYQIWDYKPKI